MNPLIQLDIDIFTYLNGFHNPFWDVVMHYISAKLTWLPLYLAALVYIFKQVKLKKGLLILLFFGLLITAADQISVHFFKNVFERLRPCYNVDLESIIHCPKKSGGHFGFVSSHATNAFAFATFSMLLFRKKWYSYSILIWAGVVAYSRIYLGVHYPADIIGGAILGGAIAVSLFKIYTVIEQRIFQSPTATQ